MSIRKHLVTKFLSLSSLLVCIYLFVNIDSFDEEVMNTYWPLHIIAMALGFIMVFGIAKDEDELFESFEGLGEIFGVRNWLTSFVVSSVVSLFLMLAIMSPFVFIVASESVSGIIQVMEFNPVHGFVFIWLLFLTMEFIYFWLIRGIIEYIINSYS
ncbi:hypothetical protein EYS14_03850 [Alteromonadaceae bacterium M269]|nr:hypothetical protein EYS14_03850 [Alteromonadaceae bacterium M269]